MRHFTDFNEKTIMTYMDKHGTLLCDDVITFDVETTSCWEYQGELLSWRDVKDKPNSFFDDTTPVSLVYLWTLTYEDNTYCGRYIEDFLYILDKLSKDVEYTIYVHNLSYEFHVAMLNICTPMEVFARAPRKPMYCRFKEYPNIEFRCSYLLTRLSLAEWAKQEGTFKKGGVNYQIERTPRSHLTKPMLEYAEQDTKAMTVGLRRMRTVYKHLRSIPYTQTGKVRRKVKHLLKKNKKWIDTCINCLPNDYDELEFFLSCFYGGYVHANYKLSCIPLECVDSYDFASSYPWVMCSEKFPMTPFVPDTFDVETEYTDKVFLLKVKLTGVDCRLDNTFISASKCEELDDYVLDNGRILKCKSCTLNVTNIDLGIIVQCYKIEKIDILLSYSSYTDYLPREFILTILEMYSYKTSLKGVEGKEFLYREFKEEINSLFGMCVTALIPEEVVYSDGWSVNQPSRELINKKLNEMRTDPKKYPFLVFTHGIFITSYAKRNLWSILIPNDDKVAYSDTDSLKMLCKLDTTEYNESVDQKALIVCVHRGIDHSMFRPKDIYGVEHPLGYFEHEGTYIEFKTLGAKRYIYKDKKGELHLTCSGINKGAVKQLKTIDEFKDNLEFKVGKHTKKLLLTYIDGNMKKVTFRKGKYDEYTSSYKFGVNARNIGYKLSVKDTYLDLINEFRLTGGF